MAMATHSGTSAAAYANEQPAAGAPLSQRESPVEMSDLQSSAQQTPAFQTETSTAPASAPPPPSETSPSHNPLQQQSAAVISAEPIAPTHQETSGGATAPPTDDASAPSTIALPEPSATDNQTLAARVVAITLLLTNSARHLFKIDEKYLRKRSVNAEDGDPFTISVYTLKELIWREWRDEWDQKPTSPGAIRLIHFGRMLDDKSQLKECRFNTEGPNVVHMTVKPQEIIDEEDQNTKGGKSGRGDRDGEERTAGCRCVIL